MSHVNRMKGRTKKVPSSDQWSRLQTETFIGCNLAQLPYYEQYCNNLVFHRSVPDKKAGDTKRNWLILTITKYAFLMMPGYLICLDETKHCAAF